MTNDESKLYYYYCTSDVFKSIITNQKFWLTAITDLNDYTEVNWTFKTIWPIVRDKLLSVKKEKAEIIMMLDNDVNVNVFQDYKFYVICFSKNKDSLSQWRGYAEDGKGFCIGIDLNNITTNNSPFRSKDYKRALGYNDIIYNQDKQIEILFDLLNSILDSGDSPYLLAHMNLIGFAPRFKNPYFDVENETRLIFCADLSNGIVTNCESNGMVMGLYPHINNLGILTTHIEIDLFKCNPSGCIKKVILGPKNRTNKETVIELMQANGFSINEDDVEMSQGTYR
jgi:hypothetical protein